MSRRPTTWWASNINDDDGGGDDDDDNDDGGGGGGGGGGNDDTYDARAPLIAAFDDDDDNDDDDDDGDNNNNERNRRRRAERRRHGDGQGSTTTTLSCWQRSLGLTMVSLSAVFFAFNAHLVSQLEHTHALSWPTVIAARSSVQLALSLLACAALARSPLPLCDRRLRVLLPFVVVRSLAGAAGLCCFYFALGRLPLSEAVLLAFTNPVWSAAWARLLLGERVHVYHAAVLVCCVVGVLLVAHPDAIFHRSSSSSSSPSSSSRERGVAIGVGLLGAFLVGLAYTMIRRARALSAAVVVVHFSLVCLVLSFAAMAVMHIDAVAELRRLTPTDWAKMAAMGLCASCGQLLLSTGLQRESTGFAAMFNYLQIPLSFVLQATLEHERVEWLSVLGAVIIVTGSVVLVVCKQLHSRFAVLRRSF